MAEEFRIFGPPGTGKTYTLCTDIIPKLADQYGEDRVMITSFTKAAAINIANRAGIPIDHSMHGTLHSIVFQALGRPQLVNAVLNEWNKKYPQWAITSSGDTSENGNDLQCKSDIYSQYQVALNRMININDCSDELQKFHSRWSDFKKLTGTVDFMDLIIRGLAEIDVPPNRPQAIVVDEAQDFTALQLALVRSWGKAVPKLYLAMDDDQAIYFFQGTSPEALLTPNIDSNHKIFLEQSYRVPSIPHDFAMKITDKISFREPKKYKPTDREGELLIGKGSFSNPKWAIERVMEYNNQGQTSVFLTSCSYMLNEIIEQLKKNGIAFHNPYKKTNRMWNPLIGKYSQILYNYLSEGEDSPYWSTDQLLKWITEIKVSKTCLVRNKAKKMIAILQKALDQNEPGLHTCREYLSSLFENDAIDPILNRDIDWIENNIKGSTKKVFKYSKLLLIKNDNDKDILIKKPNIMIGTIHSFKGCEADNVFLFPDVSSAAKKESLKSKIAEDNLHRLMYVGATRTLNRLILMNPSSTNYGNHYKFEFK